MANIAYAREFNGSSDNITFDVGGITGSWGAATFAAIVKPQVGGAGHMQVIRCAGNALLTCNAPDDHFYGYDHTTLNSLGNDPYTQDEWNLICWTKPAGLSTATMRRYRYSNTTWTHSAGEGGDLAQLGSTTTLVRLGSGGSSEYYDGLIAVAAVWKSTALTQGQVEGLTADIDAWDALSPTALWLLDQASTATSVTDRTGTSDQNAISGTTATAITDLTFDVGGAVGGSTKHMALLGVG